MSSSRPETGPPRINKPLVIAGTASGVGKTTVALGIMGALRRRGLRVAPFKAGPDYIDPGFHEAAAGLPARNLDTWLTSAGGVRDNLIKGAAGADVSVIEGVMGLFDGRAGAGVQGSTAEIAHLTGGIVILVVDCASMSRSLAALLHGFATFDSEVAPAGVVLNNVGSDRHRLMLEDAAREAGMPVLGVMRRHQELALESRHLGLVPAAEADREALLARAAALAEEGFELDRMLELATRVEGFPLEPAAGDDGEPVTIAVARDEAFSFYYQDGLEALAAAGARITFFSPLRDSGLPACDGIYLGGGFPEVFAERLEANSGVRAAVAEAVDDGIPTYAECGGLVYLCRGVEIDGATREMAGALPLGARMKPRRQMLGYVEAEARRDSILFAAGETVRGHEFHWSSIDWEEDALAYSCTSARRDDPHVDGFCRDNVLASYVHINFAGNRGAAARFVKSCRQAKGALQGAV